MSTGRWRLVYYPTVTAVQANTMATIDLPTPQGTLNSTFTPPPTDGSLTLAQIFDHHYLKSRDHTLFRYEDDAGKVIDIEWGRAVLAMHLFARIVLKSVTVVSSARPVVAILAAAGMWWDVHCLGIDVDWNVYRLCDILHHDRRHHACGLYRFPDICPELRCCSGSSNTIHRR